MKKVFIIEDNEEDFLEFLNILQNYNLQVWPSNRNEQNDFSDLLINFARDNSTVVFERIINQIKQINPDIFFIDINLRDKNRNDISGLKLLEYAKSNFPNAKKVIVSQNLQRDFDGVEADGWIYKKRLSSKRNQIKALLEKYSLHPISSEKIELEKSNPDWYSNIGNNLTQIVRIVIDRLIILTMYITLGLLLGYFIWHLITEIKHQVPLIRIAENVFIGLLPFLTISAFYIFYLKSIQPHILDENVNAQQQDFDSASDMLSLTKRLFLSSLVSYLFIKAIDILKIEEDIESNARELAFENSTTIKLICLAVLIAIIIGYYFLIEFFHKHEKKS